MEENENIAWLYGLSRFGIVFGLRNINELMRRLGNPQKAFRTIHVAGTDGKGSTCAMLASIFDRAGIRTGLFTSPHIINFSERIRISGEEISDEDLDSCIRIIKPMVEDMGKNGMQCTSFEVMTAIAFLYFREKKVEYAIIEVGMGGRYDATNVIIPEVSIITKISMEHTEFLGDTIKEIATEKAGIIKRNVPVVTNNTGDALDVIESVAVENGSDICITEGSEIVELNEKYTVMRYSGKEYRIAVVGDYQASNAELVIEAVRHVSCSKKLEEHITEGLENVYWPCRLQKIDGMPLIVDVSHTSDGSRIVFDNIKKIYGDVTVVFGILSDKDVEGIAKNLSTIASKVVITLPPTDRAMKSDRMIAVLGKYIQDVEYIEDFNAAMDRAMAVRGGENVLVTGSFYMAEGALRWLKRTSA